LYGWQTGQAQVQIACPLDARQGGPEAWVLQRKFIEQVVSELTASAELLAELGS
jgi:hypothetical protein